MKGEKLLTASDLAELCQVDLKTIHNWVDQGRSPPWFRTPGRHLRFKAIDAVPWLVKHGYTVPKELQEFLPAPAPKDQRGVELDELVALAEAMTAAQRVGLLDVARGIVGVKQTGAAA